MDAIETDKQDDALRVADSERVLWRVVAASARGSSHEKNGLPCQDKHCVETLSDGSLLIAVADGAGSAARSEIGAMAATQAAVNWLSVNIETLTAGADDATWEQTLFRSVAEAREKVSTEAAERKIDVRELASTLIVVVARPGIVAVAQVGDGAAVVRDQDGQLTSLTTPQFGECINETTFLTSADALTTLQSNVWRGQVRDLAVFSDGLQLLCLKMPEGIPHPKFFAPFFRLVAGGAEATDAQTQIEEFLSSARIRQFTDDDLTLVLATFLQPPCLH